MTNGSLSMFLIISKKASLVSGDSLFCLKYDNHYNKALSVTNRYQEYVWDWDYKERGRAKFPKTRWCLFTSKSENDFQPWELEEW